MELENAGQRRLVVGASRQALRFRQGVGQHLIMLQDPLALGDPDEWPGSVPLRWLPPPKRGRKYPKDSALPPRFALHLAEQEEIGIAVIRTGQGQAPLHQAAGAVVTNLGGFFARGGKISLRCFGCFGALQVLGPQNRIAGREVIRRLQVNLLSPAAQERAIDTVADERMGEEEIVFFLPQQAVRQERAAIEIVKSQDMT